MTEEDMELCLDRGAQIVRQCINEGSNVLSFGEMGAGNTSVASVWMHLFTGIPLEKCVGAGSGLNQTGVKHKLEVLQQAVDHFCKENDVTQKQHIIAYFGGYELVMFDTDLANSEERKLMTWEFVKCLEDTSFQANFSITSGLNPTRVSSYTNADYTTYLSSNTAQSTACAISSLMVGDYYTPKTFVDATYFKNNLANALVQIIKGANAQETLNKYAQDMRK